MKKIKVLMVGNSLNHQGGITTVQKLILHNQLPNLEIHQIASYERGTMFHRINVFGHGLLTLLNYLLTQDVDLVHIHCSDGGSVLRKSIIATIAMLFRRPIVMQVHAELNLTYKALPTIAQNSLGWVFRHCDQFILLSQSMQNFYIKKLQIDREKIVVLPNPIEVPKEIVQSSLTLDKISQTVTILFLGRISKLKGVFDLIQAFHRLSTYERSPKLLLAGDGDIEHAQALVEQLKLSDRVSFLGWINDNQRNTLLSQTDIFVLPSYTEQLPMSILEAMAWGVPVITCPVGGIPDIVTTGENGWLVSPGNIQQLAEAMQLLIDNPSLQRTLGLNARKRVTEFDIKNYMTKLTHIYYECTSTLR